MLPFKWTGVGQRRSAGPAAVLCASSLCVLPLTRTDCALKKKYRRKATDVLADPTLPPLKAVQLGYPLADFSSAVATKADFEQAIAAPELRQVYDAVKAEKCATAWSHVPPGPAT